MGPLCWHGLTLIPACINNYMNYKVWDEITYSFPIFNGTTVEAWEWISNFIPHLLGMWLLIHAGVKANLCLWNELQESDTYNLLSFGTEASTYILLKIIKHRACFSSGAYFTNWDQLVLWHGWVITSTWMGEMWLLINASSSTGVHLSAMCMVLLSKTYSFFYLNVLWMYSFFYLI